jgi:hypothetical protein
VNKCVIWITMPFSLWRSLTVICFRLLPQRFRKDFEGNDDGQVDEEDG